MNHRKSAKAFTALAATAVLALPTGTANAAPAGPRGCDLHIGNTYRYGNLIRGTGSIDASCPAGTWARIELQWHRWRGWENRDTLKIETVGQTRQLQFNCQGSGIHSFRTIIWNSGGGGIGSAYKQSNEIREDCG